MSNTKHGTGRSRGQPAPEKFPDISQKETLRYGISTLRRREPTNQFMSSKAPSMVWDFRKQMPIVPEFNRNSFIEASQSESRGTPVTMNKTGRPYALDTFVGGSPDNQGAPLEKPIQQKMTER